MSRKSRIPLLAALVVAFFGIGASTAFAQVHHDRNRHHRADTPASAAHHHRHHAAAPVAAHHRHHPGAFVYHRHHHGGAVARGRRHHAVVSRRHHRGHVVVHSRRHRYAAPHAAIHRHAQLCQQVMVHGSWVSRCR
jgi:hypothetical protein